MRKLLACLSFSVVLATYAQQCTITPYAMSVPSAWTQCDMFPDGGLVLVESNNTTDLFDDVLLKRIAPSGATLWTKVLSNTNPLVGLQQPARIVALSDGGAAIFGHTKIQLGLTLPYFYSNYYGIRVDGQGAVVWARYFMYYSDWFPWENTNEMVAALPSGELLVAIPRSTGLNLLRLGADGMPLWEHKYDFGVDEPLNKIGGLIPDDVGGVFATGLMGNFPFAMHVDDAGEILWANIYQAGGSVNGILRTSEGDLLMLLQSSILRTGSDGTFQWQKQFVDFADHKQFRGSSNGTYVIQEHWSSDHLVINGSGTPVAAWSNTFYSSQLIGIAGDTIIYQGTIENGTDYTPSLARAWPVDNLGCIGDAVTTSVTDLGDPGVLIMTVPVSEDTIATWTMSLGEPVEYHQLDLEALVGNNGARPGFETICAASVRNTRGLTSGVIETVLTYDPMLTFVSAIPAPTSVSANTITWSDQAAVEGFTSRPYVARFDVPVSAPLGTPLSWGFSVVQDSTELSLLNNSATYEHVIVNSYDPNDKSVSPADNYYVDTDTVLTYTIRFQNTGTAEAINVAIHDTLPPEVHASSFVPGPSSHPYTYSLTGNGILNFQFDNINLPDSNANEAASHGFVTFRIKLDETLMPGTEIRNAADIYFDFNEPIHTNDAVTVITISTGTPAVKAGRLKAYPVPARDVLTLVLPAELVARSYEIHSVDGREVFSKMLHATTGTLAVPLQALPPGTYQLTVRDAEGRGAVVRFVKE